MTLTFQMNFNGIFGIYKESYLSAKMINLPESLGKFDIFKGEKCEENMNERRRLNFFFCLTGGKIFLFHFGH